MPAVATYLETHLTMPTGGAAFDLVRDKTEHVRTTLGDVYGASGSMTRYLTSAGSALVGTARDYREVDRDQWEAYDELVTATGETDGETSFYDTSTGGETLGVSQHDVTSMLREPTGSYMMEGWQTFQDNLNYCLDLSFVIDALLSVPLFQTFPSASDADSALARGRSAGPAVAVTPGWLLYLTGASHPTCAADRRPGLPAVGRQRPDALTVVSDTGPLSRADRSQAGKVSPFAARSRRYAVGRKRSP